MMALPDRKILEDSFRDCGYQVSIEPPSEGAKVLLGEINRELPLTGVWFVKATAVVWNIAAYVGFVPGMEPRDEVRRFNFVVALLKESHLASCGRVGLRETPDHRLLIVCETMLVYPQSNSTNCIEELRYRLEQLTALVEATQRLIDSY